MAVSVLQQLVVEGKNDCHVVYALVKKYQLPQTFKVIDGEGYENIQKGLPVRLKTSGLQTLGVVIDADQNLVGKWEATLERLRASGYKTLPIEPDRQGTIIVEENLPTVGIWIMPNNHLPGMPEDFVALLIPPNDSLVPKAEKILAEIESENINQYSSVHHAKAFIHTWLAWQKNPGLPFGLSVTASFDSQSEVAVIFVAWLSRLFGEGT